MSEVNVESERYYIENIIKLQNPIILNWETYLFERLNDISIPMKERCLLILKELYSIGEADKQNGTHNYIKIIHSRNELLKLILEEAGTSL